VISKQTPCVYCSAGAIGIAQQPEGRTFGRVSSIWYIAGHTVELVERGLQISKVALRPQKIAEAKMEETKK
jgi:hypothetical protein